MFCFRSKLPMSNFFAMMSLPTSYTSKMCSKILFQKLFSYHYTKLYVRVTFISVYSRAGQEADVI